MNIKRFSQISIWLCLLTISASISINSAVAGQRAVNVKKMPDKQTRELLVFMKQNLKIESLLKDHTLKLVKPMLGHDDAYVVSARDSDSASNIKQRLLMDKRIKRVFMNKSINLEPHYIPTGEYVREQWHLFDHSNSIRPNINVKTAWGDDVTGNGVAIGIVDTGVEYDHEDLSANYLPSLSYDFVDDDTDPYPWQGTNQITTKKSGHGTAVAGIAAADGKTRTGIAGVAPGAKFAAIRIPLQLTYPSTPAQVEGPSTLDSLISAYTFSDNQSVYTNDSENTSLFAHGKQRVTLRVKNHSFGNPRRFDYDEDITQAKLFAISESTASGMIHVTSAGNYRQMPQKDTNKSDLGRSTDLIFVAAVGCHGKFSQYSNYGSNIVVSAPSTSGLDNDSICGEDESRVGILTTDRAYRGHNLEEHLLDLGYSENPVDTFNDHLYTSVFGGTSAAAPIVTGVMALGVQAQPNLNTRFAKHLLAKTSKQIDAIDTKSWIRNAAGIYFNQNYGFGLIDASAFVDEAKKYQDVSEKTVYHSGKEIVNQVIPNQCEGLPSQCVITKLFSYNAHAPVPSVDFKAQMLEEVIVTLDIQHPYRGLLFAEVISPSGTKSPLFSKDLDDNLYDTVSASTSVGIKDWPFVTHAFWGENPNGQWQIRLFYGDDNQASDNPLIANPVSQFKRWNSASLQLNMGHLL